MLNRLKTKLAVIAALAGAVGQGTRVLDTSVTPRFTSRDSWENTPDLRSLRGPLTKHDHERIAKARAKRQRKAAARLRRL